MVEISERILMCRSCRRDAKYYLSDHACYCEKCLRCPCGRSCRYRVLWSDKLYSNVTFEGDRCEICADLGPDSTQVEWRNYRKMVAKHEYDVRQSQHGYSIFAGKELNGVLQKSDKKFSCSEFDELTFLVSHCIDLFAKTEQKKPEGVVCSLFPKVSISEGGELVLFWVNIGMMSLSIFIEVDYSVVYTKRSNAASSVYFVQKHDFHLNMEEVKVLVGKYHVEVKEFFESKETESFDEMTSV